MEGSGAPIPGATVVASSIYGSKVVVDADGSCDIVDVLSDSLTVFISRPGYEARKLRVRELVAEPRVVLCQVRSVEVEVTDVHGTRLSAEVIAESGTGLRSVARDASAAYLFDALPRRPYKITATLLDGTTLSAPLRETQDRLSLARGQ